MKKYSQKTFGQSFSLPYLSFYFLPLVCITLNPLHEGYHLASKLLLILLAIISGLSLQKRAFPLAPFLILSWMFLATCWSISPSTSLRSTSQIVYYVLLYLIFRYTRFRTADLLWGIRILTVVAVILVVDDGLRQLIYGHDDILRHLEQNHETSLLIPQEMTREWIAALSGRVFSRFALPSQLAGYLLMILPLNYFLVLRERHLGIRILWGIALVLNCIVLFYTKSFGAWLALLCLLTLSVYLWLSRKIKFTWQSKLAGGFGVLIGGAGILYLIGMIRGQYLWDFQGNNPLWYRFLNWKAAFLMFRDFPFLGSGFSTFGKLYPQYMVPGANESQYVHNSYLQIGSELGLIGLIIVIWLLGHWGGTAAQLIRNHRDRSLNRDSLPNQRQHLLGIRYSFFLGGLGFLLHNIVDFDFYVFPLSVLGITLLALAGNTCIPPSEKFEEKHVIKKPFFWAPYVLASCGLLAVYIVDLQFTRGQQVSEEAQMLFRKSEYQDAYTTIQDTIHPLFLLPEHLAMEGSILLALEQPESAIRLFEAAIAKEATTPWFHAALAEAYLTTQNISMAYLESRRAAELFPQKIRYQQQVEAIQNTLLRF